MSLFTVYRLALAAGAVLLSNGTLSGGEQGVRIAPAAAGEQVRGAATMMARPVLGYAVTSPRKLQPILGVPGSAVFGRPVSLPAMTSLVLPAPGQAYALLELRDGAPALLPLEGGTAGSVAPIAGGLTGFDRVAFSPAGRSAVLYRTAPGRLQVIGGLPDAPQIRQDINTGTLTGEPEALAVSDDGTSVLFSISDAVYQLLPTGLTSRVASLSGAAALTFLPGSSDGAIADQGSGTLSLVRGAGGAPAAYVLATGLDGLASLTSTADGRALWVTCPARQLIWSVSTVTGEVRIARTAIGAPRLDRLRNGDMFLIASEPDQPAWILFSEAGSLRTVFVPAAPGSNLNEMGRRIGR